MCSGGGGGGDKRKVETATTWVKQAGNVDPIIAYLLATLRKAAYWINFLSPECQERPFTPFSLKIDRCNRFLKTDAFLNALATVGVARKNCSSDMMWKGHYLSDDLLGLRQQIDQANLFK